MFIGIQYLLIHFFNSVFTGFIDVLLKQIEQNHDMKEELNQILENLEESIMIISDHRAEFINQRFLSSFSKDILASVIEPK